MAEQEFDTGVTPHSTRPAAHRARCTARRGKLDAGRASHKFDTRARDVKREMLTMLQSMALNKMSLGTTYSDPRRPCGTLRASVRCEVSPPTGQGEHTTLFLDHTPSNVLRSLTFQTPPTHLSDWIESWLSPTS